MFDQGKVSVKGCVSCFGKSFFCGGMTRECFPMGEWCPRPENVHPRWGSKVLSLGHAKGMFVQVVLCRGMGRVIKWLSPGECLGKWFCGEEWHGNVCPSGGGPIGSLEGMAM